MIRRVVLIGSGNVAEALARTLAATPDLHLVQLWARNAARAAAVADPLGVPRASEPAALDRTADLYLLAVSDRAVGEAAAALPIPPDAVVAHSAGSVPLEALAAYPRRAIVYPFQSFTAGRAVDLRRVPLFLECADAMLWPDLEAFARTLSDEVHRADSAQRARIHLAGVFANNFTNCLYGLAAEVLEPTGFSYDILKPLIAETAAKAVAAADPADAQTGPAVRNDRSTIDRHLQLLADHPAEQAIYEQISQAIWKISKRR